MAADSDETDCMSTVLPGMEVDQILQPVESDLLSGTAGLAIEWYGRAATALYRAFQLAKGLRGNGQGVEVIIPSISCATPANTALLAGVTPRFADVEAETGMPTLEMIQERWTASTAAVVFIHLYGQTVDLKPLAEWCGAKGILLIEDLAQALGALLPDETSAGSVGDLSVYSFSPTKILECGGGALLIRNPKLIGTLSQLEESDPLPPEVDEAQTSALALSYRNLHHSLVSLLRARAINDVSGSFLRIQQAFRPLYRRRMKNAAALLSAWGKLESILSDRRRNAEQYEEILADGPWRTLNQWRQSGVCWRYSLLVDFPDQLVEFSDAVRRDGFHVSNLYWPINDFFSPSDSCPNADRFARRIVNLWVDASIDHQWAHNCAKSLLKNRPRKTMSSTQAITAL